MKSSHKANTEFYSVIKQLSLYKLFKCDCVGRKKKHYCGSFQNGKFDLTSPSKKPNWYMGFQHELNKLSVVHLKGSAQLTQFSLAEHKLYRAVSWSTI